MLQHMRLALGALLVPACIVGTDAVPIEDDPPLAPDQQRIVDEAVGVSVVLPADWKVAKDPVLFDTHGFFVQPSGASHHHALARVALAYQATPDQLEALVAEKLTQYAAVNPRRVDLTLPDGRAAIAITGLPGTDPYSVVYTSDGDRVYEVGLWSQSEGEADAATGLEPRHTELLAALRFREPTESVVELGLVPHDLATIGAPPPELAEASAAALASRGASARRVAASDPDFAAATTAEIVDPPVGIGTSAAAGCGFSAPDSLYWQLQWDDSNTFYSGTYYDLRARSGWSAMSGNYGSWWGTNYHVGLCYTQQSNQYYANDWPAQHWANAYAAFSGYVEWAGWGTDGFATLGRYVVVRNGNYRSTTAHLTAIRAGVQWGAWIDGYWDIIGWAGDTGGPWDPHLHARVSWGESLTWNGQPYGGQSVAPSRLRCFDCTDYDLEAPGAGGFYTWFFHGRWMRY